jgi:MFS family permease
MQINSFFGQTQFQQRFGDITAADGSKSLSAPWQSGLTNSALVGQMAGLIINSWAQDRFGSRPTYIAAMGFMTAAIFVPVFAPSLSVLAFGEAMCGIPWGIFREFESSTASADQRNTLHGLCIRNRAHRLAALCDCIRLHVLGGGDFDVFRRCAWVYSNRERMG